jgi:N-acetylmuramoyl-L-alanine amidase
MAQKRGASRRKPSSRQATLQRLQRRLLLLTVVVMGLMVFVAWAGGENGRAARWLEDWRSRPAAQAAAQGRQIGLIAGHMDFDSGAICPDGLTEAETVQAIAERVARRLEQAGARVDVLAEYDARLNGYTADVLVSIHADSCLDRSGFKVARSETSVIPAVEDDLVDCLRQQYIQSTAIPFDADSITADMTGYHAFQRVAPQTAAAIIETGYLDGDSRVIVRQPDLAARGIANGIICFLQARG